MIYCTENATIINGICRRQKATISAQGGKDNTFTRNQINLSSIDDWNSGKIVFLKVDL